MILNNDFNGIIICYSNGEAIGIIAYNGYSNMWDFINTLDGDNPWYYGKCIKDIENTLESNYDNVSYKKIKYHEELYKD